MKRINSELWHACAGPLVSLPTAGSLVVYFPQGHSEQVAASMQKEMNSIPNYPLLPSKLICVLHSVILLADPETDDVYAQMTLQPINKFDREALLASEIGLKQNKRPTEFFCKTLTASDTSTHGGFSVPRRAAEKIFSPLDFSMHPPAQEILAKDLHDITWTFRHIFRGQPKRHLLTTGWSVFVSTKRLFAGDSVLFIRDEKSQLLLGTRRTNRQQPGLSSSVLSTDSMHIGILAAAAHAAENNSPFTIFYNPRASPSEFVVPFAKYNKSLYTQLSLGTRFRMMFETEECGIRRYMGTITGICDLDPLQWKSSQWRNIQVGWDEPTSAGLPTRLSLWEIEPVAMPFYICPPPFFKPKFSNLPDEEPGVENVFKRAMPWLGDETAIKDPHSPIFCGLSLVQWMAMQQNSQLSSSSSSLQDSIVCNDPSRILSFQPQKGFTTNLPTQPVQVQQPQQEVLTHTQSLDEQFQSPNYQIQQQQVLTHTQSLDEQFQSPVLRQSLLQFHQPVEQQQLMLQKLQQPQMLSQLSHRLQSQLSQEQQNLQHSTSNQISGLHKSQILARDPFSNSERDAPSCSTSPSSTGQVSTPCLPNKVLQELQNKQDVHDNHDIRVSKEIDHNSIADQLAASSSGSFCLDGSSQEGFSLPTVPGYNNILSRAGSDILRLNTSASWGLVSRKDIQSLVSGCTIQRDVETEASTVAVSSEPLGLPDVSFKPVCSSDAGLNEAGTLNQGMWASQPQRMRTYTKVQKRGSVGRSIDITRYRGYDELRHGLACMFGIEGQLENPHQTDWKLVYVDHENDILLVGDDPWGEFVSCVQSIKILSPMEVQHMSLAGDLPNVAMQNPAGSGSEGWNAWTAEYDDNSIVNFRG